MGNRERVVRRIAPTTCEEWEGRVPRSICTVPPFPLGRRFFAAVGRSEDPRAGHAAGSEEAGSNAGPRRKQTSRQPVLTRARRHRRFLYMAGRPDHITFSFFLTARSCFLRAAAFSGPSAQAALKGTGDRRGNENRRRRSCTQIKKATPPNRGAAEKPRRSYWKR